MIKGDKVKWTYRHWLNSRQSTWITKEGEYLGLVRGSDTRGKVQFKDNKNPTVVKISELELINE